MLFLAQFAPTNGIMLQPPKTSEEIFYADTYHSKIIDSLRKQQYNFDSASDVKYLIENPNKYNLVWSLYNRLGFRNSEVFVQSLCEYLGIKYIGATPNIRALAEDKSMSKQLAEHLEIPTPDWVVASKKYPLSKFPPFLGPYFVKPRFGSASIDIDETCICQTWEKAINRSKAYFDINTEVIVEQFINGTYFGVPLLNTVKGSPIIGVPHYQLSDKKGNIITHSQKRFVESGMTRFISNDENLNKMLVYISSKYFNEMQPCDYARIDFMLEEKSRMPYFLEVNVLMNLGTNGGFVESFLKSHFKTYDDLISHIVDLGYAKL